MTSTTLPVLPMDPLTRDEVARLTEPLTHAQILRAEPDIDYAKIMDDPKLRTNARVFANCVGSLVALGYGYEWLARVLDAPVEDLLPPLDAPVSTDLMRDALTVAIRIGSRWATPESTGQTEEEVEHAKARARADHRQTPAAYDPVYNYVRKSAPVEGYVTKRSRDTDDARKIQALALTVKAGGGAARIAAERVGLGADTVARARQAVGLRVLNLGNGVALAPGQHRLTRLIQQAAAALDLGNEHPTTIWTRLLAEAADLNAEAVANRSGEMVQAA